MRSQITSVKNYFKRRRNLFHRAVDPSDQPIVIFLISDKIILLVSQTLWLQLNFINKKQINKETKRKPQDKELSWRLIASPKQNAGGLHLDLDSAILSLYKNNTLINLVLTRNKIHEALSPYFHKGWKGRTYNQVAAQQIVTSWHSFISDIFGNLKLHSHKVKIRIKLTQLTNTNTF